MTDQTMRATAKEALGTLKRVFEAHGEELGWEDITDVRQAYGALVDLATFIPDEAAGSPLPYAGMEDRKIAAAARRAEKGFASPGETLELIGELRRLRQELRALGGPYGVTESAIRSMISEGFHTALRKAVDSMNAAIAWKAIRDMDGEEYAVVCRYVSEPIIRLLREAEQRAQQPAAATATGTAADTGTPAGTGVFPALLPPRLGEGTRLPWMVRTDDGTQRQWIEKQTARQDAQAKRPSAMYALIGATQAYELKETFPAELVPDLEETS